MARKPDPVKVEARNVAPDGQPIVVLRTPRFGAEGDRSRAKIVRHKIGWIPDYVASPGQPKWFDPQYPQFKRAITEVKVIAADDDAIHAGKPFDEKVVVDEDIPPGEYQYFSVSDYQKDANQKNHFHMKSDMVPVIVEP